MTTPTRILRPNLCHKGRPLKYIFAMNLLPLFAFSQWVWRMKGWIVYTLFTLFCKLKLSTGAIFSQIMDSMCICVLNECFIHWLVRSGIVVSHKHTQWQNHKHCSTHSVIKHTVNKVRSNVSVCIYNRKQRILCEKLRERSAWCKR